MVCDSYMLAVRVICTTRASVLRSRLRSDLLWCKVFDLAPASYKKYPNEPTKSEADQRLAESVTIASAVIGLEGQVKEECSANESTVLATVSKGDSSTSSRKLTREILHPAVPHAPSTVGLTAIILHDVALSSSEFHAVLHYY